LQNFSKIDRESGADNGLIYLRGFETENFASAKLQQICLFYGCAHKMHRLEGVSTTRQQKSPVNRGIFGDTMEDTVQKSCWGVTARAVIGFVGLLALIYLFGGL
jgi:hypothetical protein